MSTHILAAFAMVTGGHGPVDTVNRAASSAPPSARIAPVEPSPSAWVNTRQVYLWSDGAVYRAWVEPGMITDIVLQPGETLIAVAAGDTARWAIGDTASGSGDEKRTHILVKPFSADLATNVVITTDRRTYHLQLTSKVGAGMVALSWNYPLDEMLAVKRAEATADAVRPVAAGLGLEQLYFGYAITGDRPAWRPLRAFDDGRQTFIEFPAQIGVDDAPPLFVIGVDGGAELVNYRMRGRFYVVDRIFATAELRLGTKKQQVVRIERGVAGKAGR
ncbi:P-type conjugative transfer protein TrbG [Novosphingobium kaempferiae]|uniref:P-type conjugative transfer protein TrbG n=1 Tax=Novosphingobium kaempferiae TaxID=2896849 RepID=UPI001E567A1A|nr:P-type conjugative transfer protein TrbG [Novosphingobium kaempferiae]